MYGFTIFIFVVRFPNTDSTLLSTSIPLPLTINLGYIPLGSVHNESQEGVIVSVWIEGEELTKGQIVSAPWISLTCNGMNLNRVG